MIPRPIRRSVILWALPIALVSAACGSDAEPSAGPAEARPVALNDPLAEIPREELYGVSPAANLWSPRFELEVLDLPAGWDGARVAILSDFHLGEWEENAEVAAAAVQRAVDSGADVVALLGDYVSSSRDLGQLRQVLAPLGGRGAVAVLGNEDVRTDSLATQVASTLRSAGVTLLRNESKGLVRNGDTAYVAGLDADLLNSPGGDQNFVVSTVGPEGRTALLLTHVPGFAARAPTGRYPIVVAANTFCGDVEVPGTPRISWVREELFPGGAVEGTDDRLFRVRGQTVLITCGIGYGYVPVRFGAAPEVPILTLRRAGGSTETEAPAPGTAVADSTIQRFQGSDQTTPPDTL